MHGRILVSAVLFALPILAIAGGTVIAHDQQAAALVRTMPAHALVNAQGMTLYLFTQDKHDQSTCTGGCAAYWPPVLLPRGTRSPVTIPGVTGTFGIAQRADGNRQLTYDGAPLYTFANDKIPGQSAGQGAQGTWWIVMADATSASGGTASPTPTVKTTDDNNRGGHGGQARGSGTPRAGSYCGNSATPSPTPSGYYGGRHG